MYAITLFFIADEPQRLSGKLSGLVNDVRIDNADIHVYINVEEGRSYTAFSRVDQAIGYDLQLATPTADIIGWLFAKDRSGIPNGFTITGARFNRTVELRFPQTGQSLIINEQYTGPDVFNYLRAQVDIHGSLPSIASTSRLELPDYFTEYTVTANQLRSHSSRSFRMEGNSLETPFTVDETITFVGCSFIPKDTQAQGVRLDVSKNFIVYDSKEQIVRYAASYQTSPVSGIKNINRQANQLVNGCL